jgi:hypothetical protein
VPLLALLLFLEEAPKTNIKMFWNWSINMPIYKRGDKTNGKFAKLSCVCPKTKLREFQIKIILWNLNGNRKPSERRSMSYPRSPGSCTSATADKHKDRLEFLFLDWNGHNGISNPGLISSFLLNRGPFPWDRVATAWNLPMVQGLECMKLYFQVSYTLLWHGE